jgi:hypothetical protein
MLQIRERQGDLAVLMNATLTVGVKNGLLSAPEPHRRCGAITWRLSGLSQRD